MREWLRRPWFVLRHRQLEADPADEMAFHRAMKERELERRGLAPADARREAQRAIGNDLLARDRARDVWVPAWLQDVTQDVTFAARLLAKDRGFTVVAAVALGLGIGVNNTLFSILNAYCIRGLPIGEADRVVYVATLEKTGRGRGISYPEFQDLLGVRSLSGLAAFASAAVALRDEDRVADRFQATYISASGFRLLREPPIVGRDFEPDDDRAGALPVVILASGVWKTRYAADPAIVGRTVIINGVPSTVIGVMAEPFGFPSNTDLWQPLARMPGLLRQERDARVLGIFGRLRDGVSVTGARAEIESLGARMAREHPATTEHIRFTTVPINERYLPPITHPAWIAFGIAGALVVLIACANVANLLIARSVRRTREIAIRASLGATRGRVVRLLLVESTMLALCGAVLGFGLSMVGLRMMRWAVPASAQPYWLQFSMDAFAFTVLSAVCLGTVFIFGLVPALHVSRTNVNEVLKEGGRTGMSGVRARRWTAAFLTSEFALTMILLSTVNGTVEGYFKRQRVDRILDTAHLLTMMVSLPADKYPGPEQRGALYEQLTERLAGIGALSSATVASALPLAGVATRDLEIDGHPIVKGQAQPSARVLGVTESYFSTLQVKLIAGRAFDAMDGRPGQQTAIVNERFAAIYAGGRALGRRIRFTAAGPAAPAPPWLTIVGVSPVMRQSSGLDPEAVVYLPLRGEPPATAALIVRAPADAVSVAPLLREEVRALDPDLPIYRVLTMEDAIAELTWNPRIATWIISIISCIAVCLSVVGLYAVTAHSVAQRTQEIGVRVALGAQPRQVRRLVLRRAMAQLGLGLIAGTACTVAWDRVFGLGNENGVADLLTVAAVLVIVAGSACLVPARRAVRVDPVVALRAE